MASREGRRTQGSTDPQAFSRLLMEWGEKSTERERAGAKSCWPCARVGCSGYPLSTARRFNGWSARGLPSYLAEVSSWGEFRA